MTDELKERRSALRRGSRWLHGHGYDPAHEELVRVAAWSRAEGIEADVQVLPDPPHTNLFHLVFEAEPEALLAARDRVAEERELWLLGHAKPTDLPGQARTELYVGEAALVLEPAEVARAMGELMEYARGG